MKEFINKLIGRLEEEKAKEMILGFKNIDNPFLKGCADNRVFAYDKATKIVNELAEEYKGGWIACSERLPEANQKVLTCDKDGWISVNVNMPYIGVRNDFECGYYVAWMPLPAPYKENENGKV